MEAVRYRGYRDHEYRSRGFDLEICRKKDRCVDNCDRNRNCRENCRKRVGSDKFHPRVKRSELEPGELSIESDSEDGGIYCGKEAIMLDGRRKFSSSNDRSCSTECQEPKTMEEDEEAAPMRNISSSRWAFGDDTLDDEEIVPKKRKISPLDATLELGEVSGSDKSVLTHSGSSGDRNDFMDIDGDLDNGNGSVALLGTDSEADDCSYEKTPEPVATCQRSFNMLQGCRDVNEFERLNKIDEGTYGVVFRARDKKTREVVALKKVKMEKATEGFPLTSLREINIMLSLQHPSILGVKEVVIGNMDSVFMVMEYMEHDLKALMGTMKQPFSQSEVKCLMLQLLSGANYLHDNWVLHRDLKTSNILLNNRGELKICDFGLSRQYGSPLKPYTPLVVTLWYRAPELLLGAKEYSTAIDMWSLGCIMAELLTKEPLFPGKTEVEQLDKIFRTLGTPNEKTWPGFTKLPGAKAKFAQHRYNKLHEKFPRASFIGSPTLSQAGFDLLNKLLTYDPEKRITAEEALDHAWFQEVPLPKSKDFMPTFPAQHAQDRCLRRVAKRPDPLEKLRLNELQARGVGTRGVFG